MKKNKTVDASQTSGHFSPIAIIGIGCLFPQANDGETFWDNIKKGSDAISELPETHWRAADYYNADPRAADQVYAKMGGFLSPVDFNPMEYGVLPNALEAIDTSQLLGMVAVEQALKDAGYAAEREFDRDKVSVILGVTGALELVIPLGARLGHPRWREAMKEAGVDEEVAEDAIRRIADSYVPWQENSFPGLLGNVVAGRISRHFNFGGTNCVVDAACGSSLSALSLAALELNAGKADMVVTGGIDTFNDIFMYTCFSKTPALSPSGHARPFDADADGTTLGEGLGIVVLKRLADAERDGDKIYALIRGIGSSSDGRGSAIYEPNAAGQEKAVKRAYEQSGITPDTIELIEAHGTGTRVGDAIEIKGLRSVFGDQETPHCAIGSIKSQIGHTKAAAGSAGLIKAALALYHKTLPPTIKVNTPSEALTAGKTPFYVNTQARPWAPRPGHPRRAGVSALGFGGSNFHCVLEEYRPEKQLADGMGDIQIAMFAAADEKGLAAALESFGADGDWRQLRRAAALSRTHFDPQMACRLALVIERDKTNRAAQLKGALTLLEKNSGQSHWNSPDGVFFATGETGRAAVLFPGQGAQYPGMLKDLALHFPAFQATLEQADRVFSTHADEPDEGRLSDMIYPQPRFDAAQRAADEARLRATEVAQPALGAVSLGALDILSAFGFEAGAFAGHSYGELPALCAGGCFDRETLHALSRLRGVLMAGGEDDRGSMLAVSAPLAEIEKLLVENRLDLILANRNTPEQGVLSGSSAEISKAAALLEAKGLRFTQLSVSAAFHSSLVADAARPFADKLREIDFAGPAAAVYSNTSGGQYPEEPDAARDLLASQLASPVDFISEIENMYQAGVRIFVEAGPGARLTGMVRAVLGERDHLACSVDSSGGKRSGMLDLARVIAQLVVAGHPLDLGLWDPGFLEKCEETGKKKGGLSVAICGANHFVPPAKRPALVASSASKAPASVPLAATASVTRPADKKETPPAAKNGGMQQALRMTQQNLQALQNLQEQTSRLHQKFLEGQEAATRSFLSLFEQQRQLLQGRGAVRSEPANVVEAAVVTPRSDIPGQPVAASVVEAAVAAPAVGAESVVDNRRVSAVLLAVVAEKTGYPVDMLEPDMALDADLGIDSIKRVEILSALQEQLPELPAVKPEDLGVLQTLGQIIEHLAAGRVTATPVPAAGGRSAALDREAVSTALLAVIAEKTGYPVDMLEPEMALDADLGIDSIKRVEILSALQEQLPELPAVKPEDLGVLQTLGQIIEHLAAGRVTATPVPAAGGRSAALDREAVSTALLAVIAEKTGYPVDMLEPEMALDADLGIDSIKRVEILSALQEKLPAAPAIKPEHLGTLQTVGQIVDFLASVSGVVDARPSAAPVLDSVQAGEGIERKVLKVVPLQANSKRTSFALAGKAKVWVCEEGSPLTDAICDRLAALQLEPVRIAVADLDNLVVPASLGGLLLLAPARGSDDRFLKDAFRLLQLAAAPLLEGARTGGAFFATVSRLNGSFGLLPGADVSDPVSGGLAGLSKTAGHEWPAVHCKAFDLAANLDDPDQVAKQLVDELFVEGPEEVGMSPQGLQTLKLSELSLPDGQLLPPLKVGDLVVVSGGARGVTAEAAVALASACRATLLLLGRSKPPETEPAWLSGLSAETEIKKQLVAHADSALKPRELEEKFRQIVCNREIEGTLRRIRDAGGQAIYRSVDLRDAAAVAAVLNDASAAHGPVRGLIHGAGVLADRLIEDKTVAQFEQVYSTKVAGLRSLLEALKTAELKFMVLFSSSTGRFGRTGQVDYAAANEVLNKMAQQQARLRPDCRVLSLNWGPWDGGMVTPALKKLFEQEGVEVIDLRAGVDYLLKELSTPPGGPVELVILGSHNEAHVDNQPQPHPNIYVSKAFDLDLSIDQYPFLTSHVIDTKAVLPMAMIIEWMAHGAIHNNPGLKFHGFNDLRILKGVNLGMGQVHSLQVMTGKAFKSDGYHVVPVELSGTDRQGQHFVHSRAKIVLAGRLPEGKVPAVPLSLPVYPHAIGDIYKPERLFHGPAFHGIREVVGCSADGVTSLVRPAPLPAEWINQPLRNAWLADPLVLDSSFQMMILWSFETYRAGSLPVFAGRYRQYVERFPENGAEIRIRVMRQSAGKAVADIEFLDPASGRLIARMEDYECVIDASLNESFQRNKLQGAA